MRSSGSASDALFAEAVLQSLSAHTDAFESYRLHRRAVADCGPPFGRVDGDFALFRFGQGDAGGTLLIVEPEGSGPGNERNILKWHRVVKEGREISLKDASGNRERVVA